MKLEPGIRAIYKETMMSIAKIMVVHCKLNNYDVYIGRPSKWGNPFKIGVQRDGTREEVLQKYREYILSNSTLLSELHELRGKVLGCWCKPSPCHGDILVELIEERNHAE